MIIIGDVPVAKSRFEKSLFDKKGFAFYQQICEMAQIWLQGLRPAPPDRYQPDVHHQVHPGDADEKITPDQLRERMNDAVGPYITKMSQKKIHQIIMALARLLCWQSRRALTWCRCTATGCAAASLPPSSTTAPMNTAAVPSARPLCRGSCQAVHAAVPGMAIDYKLAVRQENPHYGNAGVVEEELAVFVPCWCRQA